VRARPFEAARLRAAGRRPLGAGVSIGVRPTRRARAASDEAPGGAVSALWLPEDPRVPETRRSWHEGRHRAHRFWRLSGLQLPRRRPRRGVATSRPRPLPAFGPNHDWAYDLVFDASASGQQIKCLTLIDEFTREWLAIDVAGSIRSGRVIEVLSRLVSERGTPRYLRSDNGPEFVSHAILESLGKEKIETALIDPGRPWQNGADESFNGKFRDECLSLEWFRSRAEAKIVNGTWRRHYNHVRPHSSLEDLTPIEFKTRYDSINPGAALNF